MKQAKNDIFHTNYKYFLPKKTLDEWLSGKALDNPCKYSDQEQKDLQKDIQDIYHKTVSGSCIEKSGEKPVAIITAGASGAGKTTLIEQELNKNKSQKNIYISASDICLKNQTRTYQKDLKNSDQSLTSRQNIYKKWEPAATAAKHLILSHLIQNKKSFYLGSTCIEPITGNFFEFLKKEGYQIKLLYVTASDEIRWTSIQNRNKTFAHTSCRTQQCVKKQTIILAKQIHSFLTYADEICFYYRKEAHEKANLVAIWTKNKADSEILGTLQIFSSQEYTEVKRIHNTAIKTLNRPDLDWEACIDEKSEILKIFKQQEKREKKCGVHEPITKSPANLHQHSNVYFINTNSESRKKMGPYETK